MYVLFEEGGGQVETGLYRTTRLPALRAMHLVIASVGCRKRVGPTVVQSPFLSSQVSLRLTVGKQIERVL